MTIGAVAMLCVMPVAAFAQDLGSLRTDTGSEPATQTDPAATDSALALPPEEVPAVADIEPDIVVPTSREMPVGAIGPVEGNGGAPDGDPYAAPGIKLGSFILRPTLDIGLTGQRETTTSQSGTPAVTARSTDLSLFADSAFALRLDSDWARHALNVTAQGDFQRKLEGEASVDPNLSVAVQSRLDLSDNLTATTSLTYSYVLDDPQSAAFYAATDPSLIPAVTGTNDPATQTVGGSMVLRHDIAQVFSETEVSVKHTSYGDAELSDGSAISQSDLDNWTLDDRFRLGIHASPVFSPFVEVAYGKRRMDQTFDSVGLNRNATRYALRLGTGIDMGEKLNGEIAAGYLLEDIVDPALADIAGATVDASFNWSPRRETDVSFGLSTTTETSGTVGQSGTLLYAANLGITHRARANLTAAATFGAEYSDVQGGTNETTLRAEASVTYWFNRFAGIVTRIGHEQTFSDDVTARSGTTTAHIGLKLQR